MWNLNQLFYTLFPVAGDTNFLSLPKLGLHAIFQIRKRGDWKIHLAELTRLLRVQIGGIIGRFTLNPRRANITWRTGLYIIIRHSDSFVRPREK